MLKSAGTNQPERLASRAARAEGVLLTHSDVVDAAVMNVEIMESEYARAYLVRRDGVKLDEEGVSKYMAERHAYHKRLDGDAMFVDAIPRNASGKIVGRTPREYGRRKRA